MGNYNRWSLCTWAIVSMLDVDCLPLWQRRTSENSDIIAFYLWQQGSISRPFMHWTLYYHVSLKSQSYHCGVTTSEFGVNFCLLYMVQAHSTQVLFTSKWPSHPVSWSMDSSHPSETNNYLLNSDSILGAVHLCIFKLYTCCCNVVAIATNLYGRAGATPSARDYIHWLFLCSNDLGIDWRDWSNYTWNGGELSKENYQEQNEESPHCQSSPLVWRLSLKLSVRAVGMQSLVQCFGSRLNGLGQWWMLILIGLRYWGYIILHAKLLQSSSRYTNTNGNGQGSRSGHIHVQVYLISTGNGGMGRERQSTCMPMIRLETVENHRMYCLMPCAGRTC